MFEIMDKSSGKLLGVREKGVIERTDYDELVPKCKKLINDEGSMSMLIDMKVFKLVEPSAWLADFHFLREFHNKIERMTVVGDKWWEDLNDRLLPSSLCTTGKVFPILRNIQCMGLA